MSTFPTGQSKFDIVIEIIRWEQKGNFMWNKKNKLYGKKIHMNEAFLMSMAVHTLK